MTFVNIQHNALQVQRILVFVLFVQYSYYLSSTYISAYIKTIHCIVLHNSIYRLSVFTITATSFQILIKSAVFKFLIPLGTVNVGQKIKDVKNGKEGVK